MGEFKILRGYPRPEPLINVNPNLIRPGFRIPPFEPMRQNRFLITFPENLGLPPSYLVRSASRPSCSINNGVIRWHDMEIKFVDPINPSVQQIFVDMIRNHDITNVMDIKIQMLDPVGSIVSEWVVNGFISEVNFGEVDYCSDSITEVGITIVVNHAILNY